jgi:hypothetical protein
MSIRSIDFRSYRIQPNGTDLSGTDAWPTVILHAEKLLSSLHKYELVFNSYIILPSSDLIFRITELSCTANLIMASLMDLLQSQTISLLLLFSICLYYVSLGFYRLYLSPLAKFPGPRLAALTYWVEIYHDVFRRGQYTFEIVKMHQRYGKCCFEGHFSRASRSL